VRGRRRPTGGILPRHWAHLGPKFGNRSKMRALTWFRKICPRCCTGNSPNIHSLVHVTPGFGAVRISELRGSATHGSDISRRESQWIPGLTLRGSPPGSQALESFK
jgi:hypothetical protein